MLSNKLIGDRVPLECGRVWERVSSIEVVLPLCLEVSLESNRGLIKQDLRCSIDFSKVGMGRPGRCLQKLRTFWRAGWHPIYTGSVPCVSGFIRNERQKLTEYQRWILSKIG